MHRVALICFIWEKVQVENKTKGHDYNQTLKCLGPIAIVVEYGLVLNNKMVHISHHSYQSHVPPLPLMLTYQRPFVVCKKERKLFIIITTLKKHEVLTKNCPLSGILTLKTSWLTRFVRFEVLYFHHVTSHES